MNYYIADTHFGHENILRFDGRPFSSTEEMEKEMIKRWNSIVTNQDKVYILGDFCWGLSECWLRILNKLKGQKFLIRGNHDLKQMNSEIKKKFINIKDYDKIMDGTRVVILSHYPILFYQHDHNENVYMLHGHVHMTDENKQLEKIKSVIKKDAYETPFSNKCQLYNVGCMLPYMDYTPRTLDEIISRTSTNERKEKDENN